MKTITKILLFAGLVGGLFSTSCVEEFKVGDEFLVKEPSVDVTVDTIFSDAVYARKFLWQTYKSLYYGLTDPSNYGTEIHCETLNALGDDCESFLNWGGGTTLHYTGNINPSTSPIQMRCNPYYKWKGIRSAYIFLENADRVPNFEPGEQQRLKAEAKMIIACHYTDMFRHYGGLPIIRKAYRPADDTDVPRATVEETVNFITGLCDDAAEYLPWQLENDEIETWSGRFTAAAAKGLKIRVLLFAASPLFNSDNTWTQYGGDAVNKLHVYYGNYDENRWQKVVTACEDFFNLNNGIYYLNQNADYRRAYRDAYMNRSNPGMLISVRRMDKAPTIWNGKYFPTIWVRWNGLLPTLNGVNAFAKADGTPFLESDMPWKLSNAEQQAALDNGTYVDPFADRDPRLYETAHISGKSNYRANKFRSYVGSSLRGGKEDGSNIKTAKGVCVTGFTNYKFNLDMRSEYNGNTIHWPYLRLAEIYLSYAEALVMVGRASDAYEWVDAVRERVGMQGIREANPNREAIAVTHPDFTVTKPSDEFLLKEILRERNCEFTAEDVRFYDLVRWRCEGDFKKRLNALLIWRYKKADGTVVNDDKSFVFNEWPIRKRYLQDGEQGVENIINIYPENKELSVGANAHGSNWEPKWYLVPFHTNEINKQYGLTQNPGW